MIDAQLRGVEFIAANTDLQALAKCRAPIRIQLGRMLTKGLGAGANPEVGRKSALEDTDRILECLEGADMVFLTAGLGGGTGTGAAPIIASLAAEIGALDRRRGHQAVRLRRQAPAHAAPSEGVEELRGAVDTLITIPNERLLNFVERGTPLFEAFSIADDVLRQAVQGITDLITIPGEINVDFADVRSIMPGMGMALMGTGIAKGEHRAVEAAQRAISSPLLEETSIEGAKRRADQHHRRPRPHPPRGAEAASHHLRSRRRGRQHHLRHGHRSEDKDEVKVTVIATGFDRQGEDRPRPSMPQMNVVRPTAVPSLAALPINDRGGDRTERPEEPEKAQVDVPFYRKAIAHVRGDDPNGFGPNWSNVDDYDIPTVLRKQMD